MTKPTFRESITPEVIADIKETLAKQKAETEVFFANLNARFPHRVWLYSDPHKPNAEEKQFQFNWIQSHVGGYFTKYIDVTWAFAFADPADAMRVKLALQGVKPIDPAE